MNEFQKEQDNLLKFLLNNIKKSYFMEDFTNLDPEVPSPHAMSLEIYLTTTCNQKCEYCYLVKHGTELYPPEINDPQLILKNLEKLYTYITDNNLWIPQLDFFSGEIWGMEFGNKVFDLTLKYVNKGMHIQNIMIPSNFSFILLPNGIKTIENYVQKFEKRGIKLRFSASIDGAVVEKETRPYINNTNFDNRKNDDFYNKLINFCAKHTWGFHPMISAHSIESQIDNYKWWHNKIQEFKTNYDYWYSSTMFLEVRNNDWTEEKIISYLKWLNFVFDYDFNLYWQEFPIEYLYRIGFYNKDDDLNIKIRNSSEEYQAKTLKTMAPTSYHPLSIGVVSKDRKIPCSMSKALIIRMGDLAIVPCHRTSYDKFIYGKFKTDDTTIIDVEAINPTLMYSILMLGERNNFKCNSCSISNYCMKGCIGSQYETTKDLFQPIDCICEFYKAKILFLYLKWKQFIKNNELTQYDILGIVQLEKCINKFKNVEPEEYNKWTKIINAII